MNNNVEESAACLQQGKAALEQGDVITALAQLTKAIALNEENVDARMLRGQLLMKMGDAKGASDDAKWLLEHNPELLEKMNGEFNAKGVEHRQPKPQSVMNRNGFLFNNRKK